MYIKSNLINNKFLSTYCKDDANVGFTDKTVTAAVSCVIVMLKVHYCFT